MSQHDQGVDFIGLMEKERVARLVVTTVGS